MGNPHAEFFRASSTLKPLQACNSLYHIPSDNSGYKVFQNKLYSVLSRVSKEGREFKKHNCGGGGDLSAIICFQNSGKLKKPFLE
jgi:hypothetical protein